MAIVFQNPGLIDLRAVQTMGLNAKEHDGAIGQFGTGLKYAIAVLLRENNKISIFRGLDEYKFTSEEEEFRGKKFQFVYMTLMTENSPAYGVKTQLGFTTDLGKNWKTWQAIRELESNCRDEQGHSFNSNEYNIADGKTSIVVCGTTAEDTYSTINDIFIQGKPLWEDNRLAIYSLEHAGQSEWFYYRGVRCSKLENPTMYRYNLKCAMELTEDRTFQHGWLAQNRIVDYILTECNNEEILFKILKPQEGTAEDKFNWDRGADIHQTFIDVVQKLGARSQHSAWKAVRKHLKIREFDDAPMDDFQKAMLEKAQNFLIKMGETRITNFPVLMANDLGEKVLGRWYPEYKTIYIAQRTFEMGFKQLLSCLYEEYIHADRGFSDNNYEMQNFLFDTIITQASRHLGEPI